MENLFKYSKDYNFIKNIFIFCVAISIFILYADNIYSMEYRVVRSDIGLDIYADGDIQLGDTEKLHLLLQKYPEVNDIISNDITIHFNSTGGNYIEGIKLGNYIFDHYYSTKVDCNNICYSSCAIAFLGGREHTAIGSGLLHSKVIEYNSKLAFHSFYSDSKNNIQKNVGTNIGENLTKLLYDYLSKIKINPDFIIPILFENKDIFLIINTPKLLKNLHISLYDNSKKYFVNSLNNENIINLANNAMDTLKNKDTDNHIPTIHEIKGSELLYDINNSVVRSLDIDNNYKIGKTSTPLKNRYLSKNTKDILSLYFDLKKLNLVPDVGLPDHMYRVDGFMNVHAYACKTPYVLTYNTNKDNFSCVVLMLPTYDVGGSEILEYRPISNSNIIYDIYPPDKNLW